LVDTHVHLNSRDLADDLPSLLTRAEEADVRRFVVVGYDLPSSERAVRLAGADARIFATVGVHPHDAKHWGEDADASLRRWAQDPRVVAIGEIGLDFYRDLSPHPAQYDAFRGQLRLAREVGLPVVIHCRDAYDETLDLLEAEAGETPVELHCFAGTAAHAERALARGWYLGVGGTVTYKKNDELREIVRAARRDLLLLETDAPYLSPEPLRGKFPNEPARIALVAERVAAVRGESVGAVIRYTTENAERFFARMAQAG
jgi:TatD DNase family protein